MGFPDSSPGRESACNAGHPSSISRSGKSPGEGIGYLLQYSWASLVAQTVKNLPTMQETWVQSLGWEVPLEEDMATHSSIFAWGIPWTEEPGGLQSMVLQRVRHHWSNSSHITYQATWINLTILRRKKKAERIHMIFFHLLKVHKQENEMIFCLGR